MPPRFHSTQTARRLLYEQASEEDVQRAIMDALEARGYEVLQTSEHRRAQQCECGKWSTPGGGRGSSRGVPDLLVLCDAWPQNVMCALEVKGPKTEISSKQKQLAARGRIRIVKSVGEALAAVAQIDALFGTQMLTRDRLALMMKNVK